MWKIGRNIGEVAQKVNSFTKCLQKGLKKDAAALLAEQLHLSQGQIFS